MQKALTTLALALSLSTAAQAAQRDAALLVYRVWEPGLDPYISRVLVTPEFVRIDEGAGAVDYTLYDRQQEIIYNVSGEDRSALVMNPPVPDLKLPDSLKLTEQVSADPEAPQIAGHAPQNVTLMANGKVCRELVAVPGLMTAAMDGMRDFQTLLGRVQAATLYAIPADMQTDCELAENVYAPLRGLGHGLPIQERGAKRSRSLVDFAPVHGVDEALFGIPAGYEQVPMPGLVRE